MIDREEKEITAAWRDIDRPLVSVRCMVYNHEKYVADALDGFLMQETDFPFEVVIHDDASTDGTRKIIEEYERRFPHIIKPVYEEENQFSKGALLRAVSPHIRGEYIAFCEGDDYWIDPNKLQKQMTLLKAHPECDICATAAKVTVNGKYSYSIRPGKKDAVIPAGDVIGGGGLFVATASLVYKRKLEEEYPEFRKFLNFDYTLQIHGSLAGGMAYIADKTCVYRYMTPGSWSDRVKNNREEYSAFNRKEIEMLKILNEETGYKYRKETDRRIREIKAAEAWYRKEYYKLLDPVHYPAVFRIVCRMAKKRLCR